MICSQVAPDDQKSLASILSLFQKGEEEACYQYCGSLRTDVPFLASSIEEKIKVRSRFFRWLGLSSCRF
jgi:hypothetical protein